MADISQINVNSYTNKSASSTLEAVEWNTVITSLASKINELVTKANTPTSSSESNSDILNELEFSTDDATYVVTMNSSGEFVIKKKEVLGDKASSEGLTSDSTKFYTGGTTYSVTNDVDDRGAASLYSLGAVSNPSAGVISKVSIVDSKPASDSLNLYTALSNGKYIKTTLLGDRVRFGSWYIPKVGLTTFNCSHDFIEIVNCGSYDFPLSNVKLGILYRNATLATTLTGVNFGIKEIQLTGAVRAGSSYLIRGKNHNLFLEDIYISIDEFDFDLEADQTNKFDFSSERAYGLLLYNSDLSKVISTNSGLTLLVYSAKNLDCSVDKRVVDIVMLCNSTEIGYFVTGTNGSNLYVNNTKARYSIVENSIVKDLYELDPAKQGFRSLTTKSVESSNYRLAAVALETIPLSNKEISFPHSSGTKEVSAYTPKASNQNKNILTDKTKPNFNKPNMVTCSFGIDASTTRCFNWVSMSKNDEYVWIKKDGDLTWHKFESYKTVTESIAQDSSEMRRVEFDKEINNTVYARIDNVFPGDSTYTYRVHKCIVHILNAMSSGDPATYKYVVGQNDPDHCSDVYTFTIYPTSWTPKVYHITDLLGFGWMEYQVWAAAAEEINRKITEECTSTTKLFPILINTGDMTLNGTRVNEWLDYYNAGKCLFNHIELMNVVGNNDLCNSYGETVLGNGDDDGKSSPYYFQVFYCYEIPNDITITTDIVTSEGINSRNITWIGPVICNGVYIPSMYYFYFGQYGYLMVNSEITTVTADIYFKLNVSDSSYLINPYTGYSYAECTQNTGYVNSLSNKSGYLGNTLENWITTLASLGCTTSKIIVACHEMPFTVTILGELASGAIGRDRSVNSKSALIGSHLNLFSKLTSGSENWAYDNVYWFSRLLLNKGIKLCIGGHKHTYALTYPLSDITPIDNDSNGVNFSKRTIIKRTSPVVDTSKTPTTLWQYDNTSTTGVTYCMLQATGYKLKSNKELPSIQLYYSYIVPETNWGTSTTEGTPDASLLYPMYGTYEYESSTININIFRVVNVTTETINTSTQIATPTTFSETSYGTLPIYSERLCAVTEKTEAELINKVNNYWVVDSNNTTSCPGITNGSLTVTLRTIYNGSTYTILGNTIITPDYTNYTMQITA